MLVIEDLDEATIERAGALVAREHAAARQVRPELPAGFYSAEVCAAALQRLCDSGHHGLVATGNGRVESALCTAAWSCPAANGGRSTGSGCSAKTSARGAARTPAPVLPGDPTWTSRDGSMTCTARSGELLDQNGTRTGGAFPNLQLRLGVLTNRAARARQGEDRGVMCVPHGNRRPL